MARKRADDEDQPAREPKRKRREAAATVEQVAYAIRHRDAIVEHALQVLAAVGVIDEGTRAHVHGLYERGDARTRLIIQELIARVMRVPVDRLEQALEDEQWDADDMSGRALDALAALELPEFDVKGAADRVRHLDVEGLIARVENKSRILQFVGDLPVKVHKAQRGMMAVGILLLVVVAASLLFPAQAQLIAFFAFLALVGLLGGLLVWWSWRIRRLARDADIDLAVMARLKPEERRLLLLRKLVLQVFDQGRAGDLVERGLDAVVPDLLRGTVAVETKTARPRAEERPERRVPPARPVKPEGSSRPRGAAKTAIDARKKTAGAKSGSAPKAPAKKATQRTAKPKRATKKGKSTKGS